MEDDCYMREREQGVVKDVEGRESTIYDSCKPSSLLHRTIPYPDVATLPMTEIPESHRSK
jgi:hypothetical protein